MDRPPKNSHHVSNNSCNIGTINVAANRLIRGGRAILMANIIVIAMGLSNQQVIVTQVTNVTIVIGVETI